MEVENFKKLENITDKLLNSAIKLNQVLSGGKKLEDLSQRELLEKIPRQYHIAKEEYDETIKAIEENDVVGVMDGLIDILVTTPYFMLLLEELDLFEYDEVDDYRDLILGVRGVLSDESIDFEVLDKCATLIIENNTSKYTTSREDFDSWKTKHQRHSCEIDGVTYYYLLDENGKGRKHDDFVGVDLSFVLEGSGSNGIAGGTNNNDKA